MKEETQLGREGVFALTKNVQGNFKFGMEGAPRD